jgi:hypothetical protein
MKGDMIGCVIPGHFAVFSLSYCLKDNILVKISKTFINVVNFRKKSLSLFYEM